MHERNPQTGSSILLGLTEGVWIYRRPCTPIVGVDSVVQLGEGSRIL